MKSESPTHSLNRRFNDPDSEMHLPGIVILSFPRLAGESFRLFAGRNPALRWTGN